MVRPSDRAVPQATNLYWQDIQSIMIYWRNTFLITGSFRLNTKKCSCTARSPFMAAKKFRFIDIEGEERIPCSSAPAVQLTFDYSIFTDYFNTIYVLLQQGTRYGKRNGIPGHVSEEGIFFMGNFLAALPTMSMATMWDCDETCMRWPMLIL